jgi:ABC-2 type transport system permease protein
MLWYKAWLETRARFVLSLLMITALCTYSVYHGDRSAMPYTQISYFYFVLHGAHYALTVLWVIAVTLLMMGGLLREKALGTAAFSLALPVSRARLMGVRIATGLLESLALAVIPWGSMFLTATLTGKANSIAQAGYHLALLMGGGLLFFAVGLLVSSCVEGEYTAPAVSLGVVATISMLLADEPLRRLSPMAFMNGIEFYDRHTGQLTGGLPWVHLAVSLLLSAVLVTVSVKLIERREF